MEITITPATIHISIRPEMRPHAPRLLRDIWRDEFAQQSGFVLEMTHAVKIFVEQAKLDPHILVYR